MIAAIGVDAVRATIPPGLANAMAAAEVGISAIVARAAVTRRDVAQALLVVQVRIPDRQSYCVLNIVNIAS